MKEHKAFAVTDPLLYSQKGEIILENTSARYQQGLARFISFLYCTDFKCAKFLNHALLNNKV